MVVWFWDQTKRRKSVGHVMLPPKADAGFTGRSRTCRSNSEPAIAMTRFSVWALLLASLACVSAWHAGPVPRPTAPLGRARAAPAMLAAGPAFDGLGSLALAADLSLPSVLLSDGLSDAFGGFIGSPLILLVPIGAGSLVGFGIIYVLVKSAEPSKRES